LLAEHRGVRNIQDLPPLTIDAILGWIDSYHTRTNMFPKVKSGLIDDASGETRADIHAALRNGHRGLPGGSSLAKLLAEKRGVRDPSDLPPLDEASILAWADAHHESSGQWPRRNSGAVLDAPPETWSRIDTVLIEGGRGLSGGSSLARLIKEHRGATTAAPPRTRNRTS
jgi:hypothetical protein